MEVTSSVSLSFCGSGVSLPGPPKRAHAASSVLGDSRTAHVQDGGAEVLKPANGPPASGPAPRLDGDSTPLPCALSFARMGIVHSCYSHVAGKLHKPGGPQRRRHARGNLSRASLAGPVSAAGAPRLLKDDVGASITRLCARAA